VQETGPQGEVRAEGGGGEEHLTRHALAHAADHERSDGGGDKTELRLGQRELDALGGDGDVRDRDKADAAAVDVALNPGDQGLRQGVERGEHRREPAGLGDLAGAVGRLLLAHPLEVGARAEARARGGEHDDPDAGVGAERCRALGQLRDHPGVHRVVLVRAVQRDGGDAVGVGGDE
jgi:hypothetical protein